METFKIKPRILIIDDDPNSRKTLSDILKVEGYEAVAVSNGAEGISKAQEIFFNVALIDLNLPDMLGTEVLERVKANSPSTEAIILTGQASLDSALNAINKGAFSYLQKPYQIEELLLHMGHVLDRQASRAEIERLASYPKLNPNPIIEIDSSGSITYLNPAAEKLFPELLSSSSHPVVSGLKELMALQPDPSKPQFRNVNVNGTVYEEHISLVPEINLLRIYLFDITDRERTQEAFRRLSHHNELILSSLGEGVYGVNLEGEATFVNPAMAAMLGFEVNELIGRTVHDLIHHSKNDGSPYPADQCPSYAAYRDGTVHRVSKEVFWRKDGSSLWVDFVSTPILEEDKIVGAVVVFRDITESVKKEQELRKSRESLAHAQQIAHIGNWEWDIIHNSLEWSDEIYRIFGVEPQEFGATYEAFLSFIRPEDRLLVEMAVDGALKEGKPYSIDHSITRRDGSVRIVHEQAEVTLTAEGKPMRMMGTVQDVTEQRTLEKQLENVRLEEEQLKALNTIATTYAHNILNALTPLRGFAELIQKSTDPADPKYKWCQSVIDYTNVTSEIVKKLKEIEAFNITELGGVEILDIEKKES